VYDGSGIWWSKGCDERNEQHSIRWHIHPFLRRRGHEILSGVGKVLRLSVDVRVGILKVK
jgi:hypothetical protein